MFNAEMTAFLVNLSSEITANPYSAQKTIETFYDVRSLFDKLPSNPTFSFELGQRVWFLQDNKIKTGLIRVRQITEAAYNTLENEKGRFLTPDRKEYLCEYYALEESNTVECSKEFLVDVLFASKEALVEDLLA